MPKKPLTRERVQRLAANPGERSKLSTSVLQKYGFGDLVRKRLLQQRLDAPVVPGSQMSNRDLAHQAGALTNVQYGQPLALAQWQAQAAPDYYAVYAKALRDSAAAAQQQGVQSGQAIQSLYGSGPNAPNSPQSTVGQAQAGTAQLLGDTGRNFLNSMAAAATGQGVQAREQALQKLGDLTKEAGAFNVAQRGKISQQEAQNVATNLVAGGNLALGQGRLAVQQQNAKSTSSRQAQGANDPYLQKYGMSRSAFLALSPAERQKLIASTKAKPKGSGGSKGPKGPGGQDPTFLAPAGQQAVVQRVHKLAQYLNSTQTWPGGPRKGKPMSWAEKINHLVSAQLEPQNLVDAAASLAQNQRQGRTNTLGPSGASALHSAGAQVQGHFKYTPGKKKKRG